MNTLKPDFLFIALACAGAAGCSLIAPAPATPVVDSTAAPALETASADPSPDLTEPVQAPGSTETGLPEAFIDPLTGLFFYEGWARLPADSAVFGGQGTQQINDVESGGPGVIAGGFGFEVDGLDALVWISTDGIRWQRLDDRGVFGGQGSQLINAVAAGPRGVVAVGREEIGGEINYAVWYAGNGVDWSRVPADVQPGAQEMLGVAALDNGFLAVGREETDTEIRGAVWYSPNGVEWERRPHDEVVFGGAARYVGFTDVVQVGGVLMMSGNIEPLGANDVDGAIWVSNDSGTTWVELPDPGQVLGDEEDTRYQLLAGVAGRELQFILVGSEADIEGKAFVNVVIWHSSDGVNWQRVYQHKPEFQNQWLEEIVIADFGWFAVGTESFGDQGQAAVWLSPDGLTWSQVALSERVFGGAGVQAMLAITAGGPGLVAAGYSTESSDQDAAIWIYVPGR